MLTHKTRRVYQTRAPAVSTCGETNGLNDGGWPLGIFFTHSSTARFANNSNSNEYANDFDIHSKYVAFFIRHSTNNPFTNPMIVQPFDVVRAIVTFTLTAKWQASSDKARDLVQMNFGTCCVHTIDSVLGIYTWHINTHEKIQPTHTDTAHEHHHKQRARIISHARVISCIHSGFCVPFDLPFPWVCAKRNECETVCSDLSSNMFAHRQTYACDLCAWRLAVARIRYLCGEFPFRYIV